MLPYIYTPRFTDPRTTPFVEPRCRGELPHLYKEGGSYFVTFRLWDAVNYKPRVAKIPSAPDRCSPVEIAGESEPPVQLGSCLLAQIPVAEEVQKALRFFHNQRYDLAAWCVMPNHVHVVFTPITPFDPSQILHSWKSYTAHRINKLLGRTGALWERESFDHLIRSMDHFEGFIVYTENTPVVAGLCEKPEDWLWSSARFCAQGDAVIL